MSRDVFVSYSRADQRIVKTIVSELRALGWSVWWDPGLLPGEDVDAKIEAALEAARSVLVVWSETSVDSHWVRGEAQVGLTRGRLISVRIDDCEPPIAFRSSHVTRIARDGAVRAEALAVVHRRLEQLLGRRSRPTRAAAGAKASPARARAPRVTQAEAPSTQEGRVAPAPLRASSVEVASRPWARRPLFVGGVLLALGLAAAVLRPWSRGSQEVGAGYGPYQRARPPVGFVEREIHPATGATFPAGWSVVDGTVGADGWAIEVVEPGSGLHFRLIEPGTFWMGSPPDEPGREPNETLHEVTLRDPFYMAVTEVTSRHAIDAGLSTGRLRRDKVEWREYTDEAWARPCSVTWEEARTLCLEIRCDLPTEQQWEYAARAGSPARYAWGDDPDGGAGKANVRDIAYDRAHDRISGAPEFDFNDGYPGPAPAASYEANEFGLFDMTGNVWEWCYDYYEGPYGSILRADPSGLDRVLRGGSWSSTAADTRLAFRLPESADTRSDEYGFRPVKNLR